MKASDYLHRCLDLHGHVTALRYGKTQRLDEVERHVRDILANDSELWDVIQAIHNHDAFDADMFGFLPEEQIERDLRGSMGHDQWQTLPKHVLVARLFGAFRQIEPTSMVLRFIDPEHYGIMSSPVATILGVRPRRKPPDTYHAYLKSLKEIRKERHFARVVDVEMALWALQVGALDGLLPPTQANALKRHYRGDTVLRQLQTRNLTVQLFSENSKLDVAEELLSTEVAVAGQLAGIEFEQLVGKRVSVANDYGKDASLIELIDGFEDVRVRQDWHRARQIRNRAIHEPSSVTRKDAEFLITTARKVAK